MYVALEDMRACTGSLHMWWESDLRMSSFNAGTGGGGLELVEMDGPVVKVRITGPAAGVMTVRVAVTQKLREKFPKIAAVQLVNWVLILQPKVSKVNWLVGEREHCKGCKPVFQYFAPLPLAGVEGGSSRYGDSTHANTVALLTDMLICDVLGFQIVSDWFGPWHWEGHGFMSIGWIVSFEGVVWVSL
jgi:NifU-like domain